MSPWLFIGNSHNMVPVRLTECRFTLAFGYQLTVKDVNQEKYLEKSEDG